MDIFRLFISEYDSEDFYGYDSYFVLLSTFKGPVEAFQLLQAHVYPPYGDLEHFERISVSTLHNSDAPARWKAALGHTLTIDVFETGRGRERIELFCALATRMGAFYTSRRDCEAHREILAQWRSILRTVLQLRVGKIAFQRNRSPLLAFVEGYVNEAVITPNFSHVVRLWLRELRCAGVDLLEYGRSEQEVLGNWSSSSVRQLLWDTVTLQPFTRKHHITRLEIGAKPEDWIISVDSTGLYDQQKASESLAGSEGAMPGAWPLPCNGG
jgi:hypothetical protein